MPGLIKLGKTGVKGNLIGLTRPLDKSNSFYVTISTKNRKPIEQIIIGRVINQNFHPIPKEN